MLTDTHSHLNFNAYKDDVDEVVKRSLENNIWMINVGSQYETSKRAVEIAENYSQGVYAAVGLHPIYAQDDFKYQEYKNLAFRSLGEGGKVVAIGEIGLDYKAEYVSFKEKQREVFLEQLDLAMELNLPVIFHCRMAHQDLIQTLEHLSIQTLRGVIHCFTGVWVEAKKYLEMGFYLGFNGIIFKLDLDKVIKNTPLDRILVETDCPYLTPPLPAEALAKAGPQSIRNEPLYVKYVVEKIAKIKNLSYEEIARATTKNAKTLFNI